MSYSSTIETCKKEVFVGIDISKEALDLAITDSQKVERFTNDALGIGEVVNRLLRVSPRLVVIESTGGYERPLAVALWHAQIPSLAGQCPRAKAIGRIAACRAPG